jgi:Arc/MetJ-type ribon-helix-helix transcriptional regulator
MVNVNKHQTFRLAGKHKEVMESLVEQGFFPNKTDVIRSGILELGVKYGVIGNGENTVVQKVKKGKG